jgi:hypothetical protein
MKLGITRTREDDAGGPALNLAAAIAEFYTDFPEFKKEVFILNHQKFGNGQDAVASIASDLDAVKDAHPEAKLGMSKSLAAGMFAGKLPCSISVSESPMSQKPDAPIFARIVIPAGEEFSARLMKSIFVSNDPLPNARFPVMKEEFNNTEMWQRYVLDHELGHAVTMLNINKQEAKVSSIGNRAECEADAYSMIRHYQRYGHDSAFPEYVRDLRNMNAVHKGDITHWTVRALNEVIELNRLGKLNGLGPHEARDLAVEIAARCHLSADAEHNMQQAFAETVKISQAAKRKGLTDQARASATLDTVATLAAETKSPGVREACLEYAAGIGAYLPAGVVAEPSETRAASLAKAATRILGEEPPMEGLRRIFRDAIIDFQSGAGKQPEPPKKKPQGPKAA